MCHPFPLGPYGVHVPPVFPWPHMASMCHPFFVESLVRWGYRCWSDWGQNVETFQRKTHLRHTRLALGPASLCYQIPRENPVMDFVATSVISLLFLVVRPSQGRGSIK